MVFKFLCITVGKYCKLHLDIQRPTVNDELSKGRCATCKGRMSVMLYANTCKHSYNVAIVNCISTYIVILNSLTEVYIAM